MKPVSLPRGPHVPAGIDPRTPEPMKPLRSATAIRWIVIVIGILVMVGAVVRGWL
jgi:hypothetical protein